MRRFRTCRSTLGWETRRDAAQQQRDADRYVRNFDAAQREARRQARAEARALRKEAEELEAYLAEKVLREADVVCATLVGATTDVCGA